MEDVCLACARSAARQGTAPPRDVVGHEGTAWAPALRQPPSLALRWLAQRAPRCRPRRLLPLLCLLMWLEPARAAPPDAPGTPLAAFSLPSISASDYWLHLDTGLAIDRDALDAHWSSLVRQPDDRPDDSLAGSDLTALHWNRTGRSPAVIDFVPTHMLASDPQRDYRPQFALANSSSSLNALLRRAGIDAAGCLAPLMRMHSTIAGSGPRTNVSLSARCSIH